MCTQICLCVSTIFPCTHMVYVSLSANSHLSSCVHLQFVSAFYVYVQIFAVYTPLIYVHSLDVRAHCMCTSLLCTHTWPMCIPLMCPYIVQAHLRCIHAFLYALAQFQGVIHVCRNDFQFSITYDVREPIGMCAQFFMWCICIWMCIHMFSNRIGISVWFPAILIEGFSFVWFFLHTFESSKIRAQI